MLHELTFVRKDPDGTMRFLLDWKTPVATKDRDVFDEETLLPIVPSDEIVQLRKAWLNRPLWSFGPQEAAVRIASPADTRDVDLGAGKTMKIVRIYHVAKPTTWRMNNGSWSWIGEDTYPYGPEPTGPKDPFLVVYSMPGAEFFPGENPKWSPAESSRAHDLRNYSPPFRLIFGSWLLELMFTPKAPNADVRRLLTPSKKKSVKNVDVDEDQYWNGLTHSQLAWLQGWPKFYRPKTELLRENVWYFYDGNFTYYFSGDHVAKFIKDTLPH